VRNCVDHQADCNHFQNGNQRFDFENV